MKHIKMKSRRSFRSVNPYQWYIGMQHAVFINISLSARRTIRDLSLWLSSEGRVSTGSTMYYRADCSSLHRNPKLNSGPAQCAKTRSSVYTCTLSLLPIGENLEPSTWSPLTWSSQPSMSVRKPGPLLRFPILLIASTARLQIVRSKEIRTSELLPLVTPECTSPRDRESGGGKGGRKAALRRSLPWLFPKSSDSIDIE